MIFIIIIIIIIVDCNEQCYHTIIDNNDQWFTTVIEYDELCQDYKIMFHLHPWKTFIFKEMLRHVACCRF